MSQALYCSGIVRAGKLMPEHQKSISTEWMADYIPAAMASPARQDRRLTANYA
jgi:hypothetical protein